MVDRNQEVGLDDPLMGRILRIVNTEFLWNYNAFSKIITKQLESNGSASYLDVTA